MLGQILSRVPTVNEARKFLRTMPLIKISTFCDQKMLKFEGCLKEEIGSQVIMTDGRIVRHMSANKKHRKFPVLKRG